MPANKVLLTLEEKAEEIQRRFIRNTWTDADRAKARAARQSRRGKTQAELHGKTQRYTVAIHKAYFPKELHPKGIGQEFVEHWHVHAKSPAEAVQTAWQQHGTRILKMVMPHVKKISLHYGIANRPGWQVGRSSPIQVHPHVKQ